jgi:archaemetzincin
LSRLLRLLLVSMKEDMDVLRVLGRLLSTVYVNAEVILADEVLSPPLEAYDAARGQYRSEHILYLAVGLREATGADAVLVVAGVDAYSDGLNFVFGEALLGRGAAVVYTPRLRPEFYGAPPSSELFTERLLKESMHELGHAFGLEHCPNPLCVMSFSNSIIEVDRKEAAYCPRCASRLREKGVIVSPSHVLPGD